MRHRADPVAQFKPFKIGGYSAVALKDGRLEQPVDGKSFVVSLPNKGVMRHARALG
jgi:hypothetical protein